MPYMYSCSIYANNFPAPVNATVSAPDLKLFHFLTVMASIPATALDTVRVPALITVTTLAPAPVTASVLAPDLKLFHFLLKLRLWL